MREKNYNLSVLEDTFSAITHQAFRSSSLTKYPDIDFERLITYNEIITQLVELGYNDLHEEMESRINDGEDPNKVIASIITKNDEIKSTMGYHYRTIKHYMDEDFMKMFL